MKATRRMTSTQAALVAAPSYSVDANWYFDTGAMDHINSDLERLAVHDKYLWGSS
jgi:hypothetical protein